jgi:hypothetical protein
MVAIFPLALLGVAVVLVAVMPWHHPHPNHLFFVNVRANTPLTDLIRSGFAAFTTMDGMPTVSASLRIGLGAKWKNSEGARQVPLPNWMTLAGT